MQRAEPACAQLFGNRLAVAVRDHSQCDMRELYTILDATTHIGMIRRRVAEMCMGMHNLDLPTLVMLEIVDVALPNCIRMKAKWDLIATVKHWRERKERNNAH